MILHPTAEQIAFALDKGHRIAPNRFMARCPVPGHDDKNPSFAITQTSEKILLYCFGGCSQRDVIAALQQRGLWPESSPPADIHNVIDREEMLAFCLAHESSLKRDMPTSTAHKRLYKQFSRALCHPFTPDEIAEMDLWCRCYSADVKRGKKTTSTDDDTSMLYQNIIVETGAVPYDN